MWRWLTEMFGRRAEPPQDERSTKAEELRQLDNEVRKTHRRISAIRAEAMQAEHRLRR